MSVINHVNVPQGLSISNSASQKRVLRSPSHPFHLRSDPFAVQPFFIAPVLAGETMKNLLMQSRVVTDPIRNPLIGWHKEYYFFYVKLRDFIESEKFEDMLLDMTYNASSLNDVVANQKMYHHSGIPYVKFCLERVMDEYFRDEGESALTPAINGLPKAQANMKHAWNSAYAASEIPDDHADVVSDEMDFGDFEKKYATWQYMRMNKMTEQSFEDYLATFGVRGAEQLAPKKPELIRFVRQWQYPSNTVNPENGSPSSAVSWSIQERADKDRFFREPGFLFGVTVTRPKVYLNGQRQIASSMLQDTFSWLPAVMKERVETSIKEFSAGTGALGGIHTSNPYIVDVRDLFVYGDQFVNFDLTETDAGLVALPKTTHGASKYIDDADIVALFADKGEPEAEPDPIPPSRIKVREDGVVTLNILGTQQDYT